FAPGLGEDLLEIRMCVAFLGRDEGRADLHAARAEREEIFDFLQRVHASRGDERNFLERDAELLEYLADLVEHAREIETRVVHFVQPGRAEMTTRVTRMLDDDGVGQ